MATKYHIVKKGDLPSPICKKYGISLSQLVKLNHLKKNRYGNYLIYVGQKLIISGKTTTSHSTPDKKPSTTKSNCPKIIHFGLQSDTDSTVFATWEWSRSNTDKYKVVWNYHTGDGVWFIGEEKEITAEQSTYNAPSNAEKVRFKVKAISKKHKVNKKEVSYWTADYTDWKTYDFDNNPPKMPPVPTVKIEKYTLTASLTNLDDINATEIEFQVIKDNSKTYKTGVVKINKWAASFSCTIEAGHSYTVRARSKRNKSYSGYSDYSDGAKTIPSTPASITSIKALSETSVQIEWDNVTNATKCEVQYTTKKIYFDSSSEVKSITVESTTHAEITGLESGQEYFFRVRATNEQGESGWSEIVSITIGKAPAAPTTWASTTTAIVGEKVILYWVHNSEDGSSQTKAELELIIGDTTETHTITNTTEESEKDKTSQYSLSTFTYTEGTTIKWKVRTAGITGVYGDWSTQRVIDIYAPPTLSLSITDNAGTSLAVLESFPFYINGVTGPATQTPIGYHVTITSTETYSTVDEIGNVKMISAGDDVYSQFYDISENLALEISAHSVDLENGVTYKVTVVASMNSGLTVEESAEFEVAWTDEQYTPNAEISIDEETLCAYIHPYCDYYPMVYYKVELSTTTGTYVQTSEIITETIEGTSVDEAFTENGDVVYYGTLSSGTGVYFCEVESEVSELVDGITLSVYRREFDGSFVEIGTGILNASNTFVTDPHPALDLARYRIVAISDTTGAVSYTDIPGVIVGETAVVIQWDEAWTEFDTTNEDEMEQPAWAGSMLKLPYNIDVSDSNESDVTLVEYIGRKRPVSYYGTQLGSTSSWKVDVAKEDKDTLYALRRLAVWMDDVYVREPSGSGYWAYIKVSFSQEHCNLVIPVTLDITRVDGGA
jgi:hypothetical protein